MIQINLTDAGVEVNLSRGAGDLRALIDYTKLKYLKEMPAEEREQFGAILGVVIARLEAELATQANAVAFERLKKLQPIVVPPPEKKLVLPAGV